jgi:integrase/recombinase XerD
VLILHSMNTAPLITIFVRHAADCKYQGDEFEKRCHCRKHFRWTQNGKQYRRKAGTRSWAEGEQLKRELEDQLAGRVAESKPGDSPYTVSDAIDVFIRDVRSRNIGRASVCRYVGELGRLRQHCERNGVYTVQGLTREFLTSFCETWETFYPSSMTRSAVKGRLRSFLRYCFQAEWITRIPSLPTIHVEQPETLPLTADEYGRLLTAIPATLDRDHIQERRDKTQQRLHALVQLMRWSGLAVRDAATLKRDSIRHDEAKDIYRIVAQREKMRKKGTGHVSVPIPAEIARELLAVANGNPEFVFWSGNGTKQTCVSFPTETVFSPSILLRQDSTVRPDLSLTVQP